MPNARKIHCFISPVRALARRCLAPINLSYQLCFVCLCFYSQKLVLAAHGSVHGIRNINLFSFRAFIHLLKCDKKREISFECVEYDAPFFSSFYVHVNVLCCFLDSGSVWRTSRRTNASHSLRSHLNWASKMSENELWQKWYCQQTFLSHL